MEKIELKSHKPKPNRMTSIEENVQLARIQQASSVSSAIYERKPNQKALKVLTVAAYILFVSMAAITLSFYYVFIWDPAATIPKPPSPPGNGKGAVICDTKIIIPENVAVRLANSTKVTAEKFYKYIFQNYNPNADGVDTIDTTIAAVAPVDEHQPQRAPFDAEPRSTDGIIASRIVVDRDKPSLLLARLKERIVTSTERPAAGGDSTTVGGQFAEANAKLPALKSLSSAPPQNDAEAPWGYDDNDNDDNDDDDDDDDTEDGTDRTAEWKYVQRKAQRKAQRKQKLRVDEDAEDAEDDDDDFEASGGLLRDDRRASVLGNNTASDGVPTRYRGGNMGTADSIGGSVPENGL